MRWWREMLTGHVYSAHFYFIFLKVSVSLVYLYKAETVWSVTFSEANPEKFNSRFRNKMFYAGVSVSPPSGFCLFILQWPWFISQYCLSLKFTAKRRDSEANVYFYKELVKDPNKDYSLTMKLWFWYTVSLVFVCSDSILRFSEWQLQRPRKAHQSGGEWAHILRTTFEQ